MMKNVTSLFVVWLFLVLPALPSEASVASDALTKARAVMQSAFQMSFLPKLPVVFHKDHFDTMFKHANNSIENINLKSGTRTVTRDDFQNDKALHIKKSAELALHIQSLIGSAHLAYGITVAIGAIKEAIDGSFLNPNGSRTKEDLYADHVGARAVFGKKKFDASLYKYLKHFVNIKSSGTADPTPPSSHQDAEGEPSGQKNPFGDEPVQVGGN